MQYTGRIVIGTVLASLVLGGVSYAAETEKKKNYAQGQLGIYLPLDDLDDRDYDTGVDLSLGYGRYIGEHLIIEPSIATFAVDRDRSGSNATAGNFTSDDYVGAMAALITVKGEYSLGRADLFAGLGGGVYAVSLYSEIDASNLGSFDTDDTDTVFGAHAVLGANYNITERFYIGMEVKYRWTGEADLSTRVAGIPVEYSGDLNGYSLAATVGFRF